MRSLCRSRGWNALVLDTRNGGTKRLDFGWTSLQIRLPKNTCPLKTDTKGANISFSEGLRMLLQLLGSGLCKRQARAACEKTEGTPKSQENKKYPLNIE